MTDNTDACTPAEEQVELDEQTRAEFERMMARTLPFDYHVSRWVRGLLEVVRHVRERAWELNPMAMVCPVCGGRPDHDMSSCTPRR